MNKQRKLFHINYKGHYELEIPFETECLCYCYEEGDENGTPHTHCGFQIDKYMRASELDKILKPLLEEPCSIEYGKLPHKKWETIVGYHTGKGNKPACKYFKIIH